MIKLPIGISDFKELREENYYYVDKTLLIKELSDLSSKVTLIPRPRRFGKTLNLSMLKYFYEYTEESNDHLFYNTQIWEYPKYKNEQGKYPVIFLTFKDCKENNWDKAYEKIALAIAEEFNRHKYLVKNNLEQFEIDKFNRIRTLTASETELGDSLFFLSRILKSYHNKRPILLIDEYDVPIHSAYSAGFYNQMIELTRSLLTSVLKDNIYLEKSILTGILYIAKSGILTGLNNLNVLNLTSNHLADKFGFTDSEVTKLLSDTSVNQSNLKIQKWYNGYRFGNITPIYNPWSVLKCAQNDGALELYWSNTSDNVLLKRLIATSGKNIKTEFEELIQNKSIKQIIDESITFAELDTNPSALWSLLLFTGYLTYENYTLVGGRKECLLKIPNEEIKQLFINLIKTIFVTSLLGGQSEELLQALIEGKISIFQELLQNFVLNSMSTYDLPASEPEKSYHLFVLGLLVMLSSSYEVKSNRESGFGRYDIMLLPRQLNKPAIIIEFKKAESSETLDNAAQRALEQIENKNYAQEIKSKGINNILMLGIAFQGKTVRVIGKKPDNKHNLAN